MTKDITSMRSTIEFLKERQELLTVKAEVDPIYEISGIQKAFENGPALLFENIKGYPQVRDIGNVFSREDRVAAIFDADNHQKLMLKCLEAIKNPLPPRVVKDAPCQEVVIKDNIDVMATLPIIKHSEDDAGRILGGGNTLITKPYVPGGSDIAFKRMHFQGKDWASMYIARGTHLGYAVYIYHKGEEIPLTINICTPPAVMMLAATSFIHTMVPPGSDELGIAGAIQGSPIEICKAKTVDAYVIANSEWVIEGYCLPERVWESKEAEEVGTRRVAPFFPEWSGYLGRASKVLKFQATAITHRRDSPIFFSPLADSYEAENMEGPLREACFYELAQRIAPGLVVNVYILHALKGILGAIFQVRKKNLADDAFIRNIMEAALSTSASQLVVAVDDDVDIHNADEVIWAITTRADVEAGIFRAAPGSMGITLMPAADKARSRGAFVGGLGIDATVPFAMSGQFKRAHYPVDRVDLRKWFSEAEIASVQSQQCEHARVLAQKGG